MKTQKTSRTEKKVYKNIKIQENKESYEIIGQLDKNEKIEFKKLMKVNVYLMQKVMCMVILVVNRIVKS